MWQIGCLLFSDFLLIASLCSTCWDVSRRQYVPCSVTTDWHWRLFHSRLCGSVAKKSWHLAQIPFVTSLHVADRWMIKRKNERTDKGIFPSRLLLACQPWSHSFSVVIAHWEFAQKQTCNILPSHPRRQCPFNPACSFFILYSTCTSH